jgi:ADP-ribose pyrophosphatase YjhB (NUDIX family)
MLLFLVDFEVSMSERRYPNRPFVAVGTIVVKNGRVLLARRGKEPSYGLWSLPGGAVDLGEGLKLAAQRETREECGIEVEITDVLEVVERMVRDADGRVQFHYVIVDYLARWASGDLQSSPEVLEARWVAPEDFPRFDMTRGTAEVVLRMLDAGKKAGVL